MGACGDSLGELRRIPIIPIIIGVDYWEFTGTAAGYPPCPSRLLGLRAPRRAWSKDTHKNYSGEKVIESGFLGSRFSS